jgi:hypothetical protein
MAGDGASRIRIRYLIELIERPWFYAPATTVVLAYAIHVTDTRTELVRGVRTLTLTLLAWLLPMMTALALAFLLALPFTGLNGIRLRIADRGCANPYLRGPLGIGR